MGCWGFRVVGGMLLMYLVLHSPDLGGYYCNTLDWKYSEEYRILVSNITLARTGFGFEACTGFLVHSLVVRLQFKA